MLSYFTSARSLESLDGPSQTSDVSVHTESTAPTVYSEPPASLVRPAIRLKHRDGDISTWLSRSAEESRTRSQLSTTERGSPRAQTWSRSDEGRGLSTTEWRSAPRSSDVEQEAERVAEASRSRDRLPRRRESTESVDTYASTQPSELELPIESEEAQQRSAHTSPDAPLDAPSWDSQNAADPQESLPCMRPSTPGSFARAFPSTRRLHIRHADSEDGNMNLTVAAYLPASPLHQPERRSRDAHSPALTPLTLFHLRIFNLKGREFSLRRYGRDSGREICHTTRRYTRPATCFQTPPPPPVSVRRERVGAGAGAAQRRSGSGFSLSRSLSGAMNLVRTCSAECGRRGSVAGRRMSAGMAGAGAGERSSTTRRAEPGYESPARRRASVGAVFHRRAGPQCAGSDTDGELCAADAPAVLPRLPDIELPADTVKLEFANYAHLDLRRRGAAAARRYEFEYWGRRYAWRRVVRRSGGTSGRRSLGTGPEADGLVDCRDDDDDDDDDAPRSKPAESGSGPGSSRPSARWHALTQPSALPARQPQQTSVSFHLFDGARPDAIAHVVPQPQSAREAAREAARGGWVPPCSLWLSAPEALGAAAVGRRWLDQGAE